MPSGTETDQTYSTARAIHTEALNMIALFGLLDKQVQE